MTVGAGNTAGTSGLLILHGKSRRGLAVVGANVTWISVEAASRLFAFRSCSNNASCRGMLHTNDYDDARNGTSMWS